MDNRDYPIRTSPFSSDESPSCPVPIVLGVVAADCCSWLEIKERRQGAIKLATLPPVAEPSNLRKLKNHVQTRWGVVPLIDILKEAVLRTGCLRAVTSVADRGTLPEAVLAERLLLAIYAYGTNTGIRAVAGGAHRHGEDDIRYARRRYLNAEAARRIASRSPTPPSPRGAPRSGVRVPPPSLRIRRISGRSIRTSSPSTTPATAAAACSSTGAWRRARSSSTPSC